jgi:hypothetical protein
MAEKFKEACTVLERAFKFGLDSNILVDKLKALRESRKQKPIMAIVGEKIKLLQGKK